jgi:penicillin amidase
MVMQRNVAWWATGKLYKHNEGVNTNFILDGASAKTTLLSFGFLQNPSAENPQWGVYSANNQPEPVDGILIQATICLKIEQKELHNLRFKVKLG